jgi:lipoate-protein ligase A
MPITEILSRNAQLYGDEVCLVELNPEITIESMKQAMAKAFAKVYDKPMTIMCDAFFDREYIEKLRQRNASWEWNYGQKLPFSAEFEDRFPWGGIQICLQVENGIVCNAKVYSDSMDWSVSPILEPALLGHRFEKEALLAAVPADMDNAEDIRQMIASQMM